MNEDDIGKYAVVENAGYMNECEPVLFTNKWDAGTYIVETYTQEEIDDLHVVVGKVTQESDEHIFVTYDC